MPRGDIACLQGLAYDAFKNLGVSAEKVYSGLARLLTDASGNDYYIRVSRFIVTARAYLHVRGRERHTVI